MTTVARDGDALPPVPDMADATDDSGMIVDTARPVTIPRNEFLQRYFTYKPGEHVTFLGPTQSGKTTLAFQLLKVSTYEKLPGVVMVMKPRDPTVTKWTPVLDYQVIKDWPPPIHKRRRIETRGKVEVKQYKGYMVWPDHTFNADRDDAHMSEVFRRVLNGCYKTGDKVLFADEIYGITKELRLERECNAIWTRGAAMGCGLWSATQRPYGIPQWAYSQPEHIFLAHDPDKRDRDRYGEIGGVDPKLVDSIVLSLPKYHWLYIHRTGPEMCIVSA